MKLQQLLQQLTDNPSLPDCEVSGLSQNSKQIQPGDLFVALCGQQQDGKAFIAEAIAKGACAVVATAQEKSVPMESHGTPIIYISDLRENLNTLASRFFGNPSHQLDEVVGVTGTNGKTTTCYLLAQALSRLNKPCAFMGTIGYGFIGALLPSPYTTLEPISLHRGIKKLVDEGAKALCMEVSSHGLEQQRVNSVNFTSAHFTNLTQDHLDYHGSMEAYGKAKQKLFRFETLKRVVVNGDSPYSQQMLKSLRREIPVAAYSLEKKPHYTIKPSLFFPIVAKDIHLDQKGITANVDTPWGQGKLYSPLLGRFNLSNVLGVLAELCLQGFEFKAAMDAIAHANAAQGRMQKMGTVRTAQIIIDYAHTPDALQNALKSAKEHCKRRLWCVFGCGGDRDKDKRPKMGAIAAELADRVIITNDNPRTEEPKKIIEAILQGVPALYGEKIIVQEDRETAIRFALSHALAMDTILIAGKGHENYQIIGDKTFPFSDAHVVDTVLSEENK